MKSSLKRQPLLQGFQYLLSRSWGKCKEQRWNSIVWLRNQLSGPSSIYVHCKTLRGHHSHFHLCPELCRHPLYPTQGSPDRNYKNILLISSAIWHQSTQFSMGNNGINGAGKRWVSLTSIQNSVLEGEKKINIKIKLLAGSSSLPLLSIFAICMWKLHHANADHTTNSHDASS